MFKIEAVVVMDDGFMFGIMVIGTSRDSAQEKFDKVITRLDPKEIENKTTTQL